MAKAKTAASETTAPENTGKPQEAPPVDNDHVEQGAELFSEPQGEAPPPETAEATPEVIPPRSIGARIRDVEKRWGKEFEHVLLDLHDHVFGKSDEHNESDK